MHRGGAGHFCETVVEKKTKISPTPLFFFIINMGSAAGTIRDDSGTSAHERTSADIVRKRRHQREKKTIEAATDSRLTDPPLNTAVSGRQNSTLHFTRSFGADRATGIPSLYGARRGRAPPAPSMYVGSAVTTVTAAATEWSQQRQRFERLTGTRTGERAAMGAGDESACMAAIETAVEAESLSPSQKRKRSALAAASVRARTRAATGGALPDQMQPPRIVDIGAYGAHFCWRPPGNSGDGYVESFTLQVKKKTKKGVSPLKTEYSGRAWETRVTGLTPNTVYSCRVSCRNKYGTSPASRFAAFRTKKTQIVRTESSEDDTRETKDNEPLPPKPQANETPLRVEGNMCEYFDVSRERCYYWNRGSQTSSWEPPEIWGHRVGRAEGKEEDNSGTLDSNTASTAAFRLKRYRFMRSIGIVGSPSRKKTVLSVQRKYLVTSAFEQSGCAAALASAPKQTQRRAAKRPRRLSAVAAAAQDPTKWAPLISSSILGGVDWCARLKIEYIGEEGSDAGGLTKDFFLHLSRRLFGKSAGLFCPLAAEAGCEPLVVPNQSALMPSELKLLVFCGRILAKAIRDRRHVEAPLPAPVIKYLLGRSVDIDAFLGGIEEQGCSLSSLRAAAADIPDEHIFEFLTDLKEIDPMLENSMRWILDNDITDVVDEVFAVFDDKQRSVDLIPGGNKFEVDDKTKRLFVALMCQWHCVGAFRRQLDALAVGFRSLIEPSTLSAFTEAEVFLMLNGQPDVKWEALRECTVYSGGLSPTDSVANWFWSFAAALGAADAGKTHYLKRGSCVLDSLSLSLSLSFSLFLGREMHAYSPPHPPIFHPHPHLTTFHRKIASFCHGIQQSTT